MATKKEELEEILSKLNNVGGIEGGSVVSRDGLVMASNLSGNVDPEVFAAMSATMLGAAETAVSELAKGETGRVIAESEQTKLIATGAGPLALLVVMTSPDATLGLALVEMQKAANKIISVLST